MRRPPEQDLDKVVGPLEADVLEALWGLDRAGTVREILELVNSQRRPPLAYTTVMTVMARLADKGILKRHRACRGYVYEPAASGAAAIAVRGVLKDFGSAAVAHFVEAARADPKLLRRLEKLMRREE